MIIVFGVSLGMHIRIRWSVILPFAGLILFGLVSYRSMGMNRQQDVAHKYYWWSSLRLDTDPLNQNPAAASQELQTAGVTPGWLDRLLVVSALPAFLAGAAVMIGLSGLGVDEVLSFMVSMPILLVAWFYFIGWLVERWTRRRQVRNAPLKIT
jgi:hypothetical protein